MWPSSTDADRYTHQLVELDAFRLNALLLLHKDPWNRELARNPERTRESYRKCAPLFARAGLRHCARLIRTNHHR